MSNNNEITKVQVKISCCTDASFVPVFQVHSKFRFPFYYEICWYVLERYLHCLTKRSYLSQEVRKEPVIMGKCNNVRFF